MIQYKFQTLNQAKPESLYQVHQVHSPTVVLLNTQTYTDCSNIQADGLITANNTSIGIQTADCMPLLLYSTNEKFISAVHAGWKGVLTGIVSSTIQMFQNNNVSLNEIKMMIGPHIEQCCFEVSTDLLNQFQLRWNNFNHKINTKQKCNSTTYQRGDGHWVNLKELIYSEIKSLQMNASCIIDESECTYCSTNKVGNYKFASFRRFTHSKSGIENFNQRQWSWIQKS